VKLATRCSQVYRELLPEKESILRQTWMNTSWGGFFRQCHVAREPEAKRKHAPGIPVVQLAKSVRIFLPDEGDQGFFTVLQVVNVVLCAWMLCV
jgi:hypothetical protein